MAERFRDFELLVTQIQRQLAPKAEVLHNQLLDGRQSKRKRQIDVLVREKVGQYEINIIIDCKDYKKPVNVKGVEEFYGLMTDVGAQKGVLVCPKGFTKSAKTRADGYQLDLYSPFDTGAHKWQVKASIPAICDFRAARMAFRFQMSAPYPFKLPNDFFSAVAAFDAQGTELGTCLDVAAARWDRGDYPVDPGVHENLDIFPKKTVQMDNGYGKRVPVEMSVSLHVEQHLFAGQLPVPKISGFKDEFSGKIITNAFTVGLLDIETIERDWMPITAIEDAPIKPVIRVQGLYGWTDQA